MAFWTHSWGVVSNDAEKVNCRAIHVVLLSIDKDIATMYVMYRIIHVRDTSGFEGEGEGSLAPAM